MHDTLQSVNNSSLVGLSFPDSLKEYDFFVVLISLGMRLTATNYSYKDYNTLIIFIAAGIDMAMSPASLPQLTRITLRVHCNCN
jgi:hypothetical protein